MSRPTQGSIHFTHTGLSPAMAGLSRPFCFASLTTGLFRVRSPLLAESLLMSFPPGTEMFQFPGFASPRLCIQRTIPHRGGLPHSDIHGSKPARGSPWLFAACHVLHRLLVPRHPPNALLLLENSLDPSRRTNNSARHLGSVCHHAQEPTTTPGHAESLAQASTRRSRRHAAPHSAHSHTSLNGSASGRGHAMPRIPATRRSHTTLPVRQSRPGAPRDAPEPDSQFKEHKHRNRTADTRDRTQRRATPPSRRECRTAQPIPTSRRPQPPPPSASPAARPSALMETTGSNR